MRRPSALKVSLEVTTEPLSGHPTARGPVAKVGKILVFVEAHRDLGGTAGRAVEKLPATRIR
jgi:hypothetical protein